MTVDELAKVLSSHQEVYDFSVDRMVCSCGDDYTEGIFAEHVASAIHELITAAAARNEDQWVPSVLGDISNDALDMLQDSNAHLSAAEDALARIVNYCENQGDKFRHHSARILEMARPTIGGASRG